LLFAIINVVRDNGAYIPTTPLNLLNTSRSYISPIINTLQAVTLRVLLPRYAVSAFVYCSELSFWLSHL